AHPNVIAAIETQARRGTSYGAPSPLEVELAEKITSSVASVEMVRFVSSGTEAVMSALRLARAATGRDAILKFAGSYHGHADALLSRAGSGLATLGLPDSAGVPAAVARDTITVAYGDLDAAADVAASTPLAAIIVEPIAGNMGCVVPDRLFLAGLRAVANRTGALLVFDEVITGFRIARSGAQGVFGVRPDLTCFGKIIGGGLPVGAYAGSRELMSLVAPLGPVYQAGTLSGNPLAVAAGLATLELLDEAAYARLAATTERLAAGLRAAADSYPVHVTTATGLLTVFFGEGPPRCFADAGACDLGAHARWVRELLSRGVYAPPSQFEAWFPSLAHTEEHVERTVEAAAAAFAALSEGELGA